MKDKRSKRLPTLLRYPGGKANKSAHQQVRAYFPEKFGEYRELFVGGAGLFFTVDPTIPRWINDKSPGVIALYSALKTRPCEFIAACESIHPVRPGEPMITTPTGKVFPKRMWDEFHRLRDDENTDLALRYLFLNRHSMFGRVFLEPDRRHRTLFSKDTGWSLGLFARMAQAAAYFTEARITNSDFEWLLDEPGHDVLAFCDPPYVKETNLSWSGKLYEYGFTMQDHVRLRDAIVRCSHKVIVSYGDDPLIRELYKDFFIHEGAWTYSGRKDRTKKGRELIITNYPVIRTSQIIVPSEMKTWVKKAEPEDQKKNKAA